MKSFLAGILALGLIASVSVLYKQGVHQRLHPVR
jgi:hypothetical protein